MSQLQSRVDKIRTKRNSVVEAEEGEQATGWPVSQDRHRLAWFPAGQRLIGLVRGKGDCYVLPPAVVRKASWRE